MTLTAGSSILPKSSLPSRTRVQACAGLQLWTTAKERHSFPNPSVTITSSARADSHRLRVRWQHLAYTSRKTGLLKKRQGTNEGSGKGLSQQQNYWDTAEAKGSDSVTFAELKVGITGCGEEKRRNQAPMEDIQTVLASDGSKSHFSDFMMVQK